MAGTSPTGISIPVSGTFAPNGGDAGPSGASNYVRFGDVSVGGMGKWVTVAIAIGAIWYIHKKFKK